MFSKTVPQIAATPDQVMRKEGENEWLFGLEVKVPFNVDNLWTVPKQMYIVQCQAQMIANPALKSVILYEWTPNAQYAWDIPRCEELQQCILNRTASFLEKVAEKKRPPPKKHDEELQLLFHEHSKDIVLLLQPEVMLQ